MSNFKKIEIFLEDKPLEERCYEGKMDDWDKGFVLCSRKQIKNYFKENKELQEKSGVYFLINNSNKKVYVGQGKIYSRLINHFKNKKWWKGESMAAFFYWVKLSEYGIKYLEKHSMYVIKNYHKEYELITGQKPKPIEITDADKKILKENTFKNMSLIMSIFGYNFLEEIIGEAEKRKNLKSIKNRDQNNNREKKLTVFCKGKNVNAKGIYFLEQKKLKVLKGSKASFCISNSLLKSSLKTKKGLIDKKILKLGKQKNYYVFNKDYMFSSPSKAASIILGHNVSGLQRWIIIDGKTTLDKAIENNIELTEPPTLFSKNKNQPKVKKGYTGLKPKSFTLKSNQYKVGSWTDLIVKLCEQVYKENRKDFKRVLEAVSLKGKKGPYFSKNKYELTKDNKKIKGTDIYVETRFNANSIVGLCKKVLKLFNYEENSFKIETI